MNSNWSDHKNSVTVPVLPFIFAYLFQFSCVSVCVCAFNSVELFFLDTKKKSKDNCTIDLILNVVIDQIRCSQKCSVCFLFVYLQIQVRVVYMCYALQLEFFSIIDGVGAVAAVVTVIVVAVNFEICTAANWCW